MGPKSAKHLWKLEALPWKRFLLRSLTLSLVSSASLVLLSATPQGVGRWPLSLVAVAADPAAMQSINQPQDAVNQFRADTQLYVQGSPLTSDEMQRMRSLLSQHPNTYVVLIDYSSDVMADDLLLSRGIGESAAFQSRTNATLNQRDGVLFMIYFDSNQGRKIFMRSEELPDRLGVGEANFADASGQPKQLLQLFINAVRNEGKDVPTALERVINRINQTIRSAENSVAESRATPPSSTPSAQPSSSSSRVTTYPTTSSSRGTTRYPAFQDQAIQTQSQRVPLGTLIDESPYTPWAGGLMMLASLTPAGLLNRKARRRKQEAQAVLDEAKQKIDGKTQALLKLIERADYAVLDQYQGQTEQKVQQFGGAIADALTLLGGTAKFVTEAEQLIQAGGLGNHLRTVKFDRAIALLSDPETRLSFDLNDSTRAAFAPNSHAETWRKTLLQKGKTETFEKSLQDVLTAMETNQQEATQLLDEIQTKQRDIAPWLQRLETEAQERVEQAKRLQIAEPLEAEAASVGTFKIPALTTHVLPTVLAQPAGLIDQGRSIMAQDPVGAWADFATPAQRIVTEATTAVKQAQWAQKVLQPALHQSAQQLSPHGIQIDWAEEQSQRLSMRLDQACTEMGEQSVAEPLEQLQTDLQSLQGQLKTVVAQDQEWREVCPNLIAVATKEVATTRQTVFAQLQQAGAFQQGTVKGMLREPEQDPSDRLQLAQQHLDQLPSHLNQGELTTAATLLKAIATLSQAAQDICQATRKSLPNYLQQLPQHQSRLAEIRDRIRTQYSPVFQQIQQTYHSDVLSLVAEEVDAGQTIADNLQHGENLLTQAEQNIHQAQTQFDTAQLLLSVASLAEAERLLTGGQAQYDGIMSAQRILSEKQAAAETVLQTTELHFSQLEQDSRDSCLRPPTHQQCQTVTASMHQARAATNAQPAQPYAAHSCLTQFKQDYDAAMEAIEQDRRAYRTAHSALKQAERSLQDASDEVSRADRKSFAYASVNTRAAENRLDDGMRMWEQGRRSLQQQDYEQAAQEAQRSQSLAREANEEAQAAVRRARRESDAEDSRRRRAAEAAAAAAYQSSQSSVSSSSFSSSGGSSGSSSSGGDSGSTGGSW